MALKFSRKRSHRSAIKVVLWIKNGRNSLLLKVEPNTVKRSHKFIIVYFYWLVLYLFVFFQQVRIIQVLEFVMARKRKGQVISKEKVSHRHFNQLFSVKLNWLILFSLVFQDVDGVADQVKTKRSSIPVGKQHSSTIT